MEAVWEGDRRWQDAILPIFGAREAKDKLPSGQDQAQERERECPIGGEEVSSEDHHRVP